jgi:hypothetical protein
MQVDNLVTAWTVKLTLVWLASYVWQFPHWVGELFPLHSQPKTSTKLEQLHWGSPPDLPVYRHPYLLSPCAYNEENKGSRSQSDMWLSLCDMWLTSLLACFFMESGAIFFSFQVTLVPLVVQAKSSCVSHQAKFKLHRCQLELAATLAWRAMNIMRHLLHQILTAWQWNVEFWWLEVEM